MMSSGTILTPLLLRQSRARVILKPMRDWAALSIEDRAYIEDSLMQALNSEGMKGAVTRWNMPAELPHWQLIIQTLWCADKPEHDVALALKKARAAAGIHAPRNAVLLKCPSTK